MIHGWARAARPLAVAGPPSTLQVELRPSGPFWQDAARTTAALVGDLVMVWDDVSGNGIHAVAPSTGERPSRALGGVQFAAGKQLNFTQAYATDLLSLYARYQRATTTADECVFTELSTAENTYLFGDPSALCFARIAVGAAVTGPAFGAADDVAVLVYGAGAANSGVGFGTNFATRTPGTATGTGIRIGAYNAAAAYPCTGQMRAFAMALTAHDSTARGAMRTYLNGLA